MPSEEMVEEVHTIKEVQDFIEIEAHT